MTPEQLIRYIDEMHAWAESCCAPVFYRDDSDTQHNGSMTFVDTGVEILGLTAGHVADSIVRYCDGRPGHGCQVGTADLDPKRLIARHRELDLASFRLSSTFATTAGKHTVSLPVWPPRPPEKGELGFFCGYPGIYRKPKPIEREIEVEFLYFVGQVESTSDRHFGMSLKIANSHTHGKERVPPNADLGGWSGGAVFRVVEDAPIARLELAGIIYEYSSTYEIVFAHCLTTVASDGAIT